MTISFLHGDPIETYAQFLSAGWRLRGFTEAREDIEFTIIEGVFCSVDGEPCIFSPQTWILSNARSQLQLVELIPLGVETH